MKKRKRKKKRKKTPTNKDQSRGEKGIRARKSLLAA